MVPLYYNPQLYLYKSSSYFKLKNDLYGRLEKWWVLRCEFEESCKCYCVGQKSNVWQSSFSWSIDKTLVMSDMWNDCIFSEGMLTQWSP